MMRPVSTLRRSANHERGSTLVEFGISIFLTMLIVFACIEFDRMVLVYTTLAEAARVGARYAIVHGCDRTGTAANGPSGNGSNAQVQTVVQEYARTGALTVGNLGITVNYPDTSSSGGTCASASNNVPGSHVQVVVTYLYDPLTILPLSVTLRSTSEGIITF